MEKITKENCNQIADLNKLNSSSSGRAWELIWDFCKQNGMICSNDQSGLQDVIGFIESLLKKEEGSDISQGKIETVEKEEFEVVTCECCQQKVPVEFTYSDDNGNYICTDCINEELNFELAKKDRKIKKLKKKNKKLQRDIVILQITNPHQA